MRLPKYCWPHRIRNNHDSEKGNAGGENQAVDKDDEPRLFQVGQFGMLDFAVHLGQRFLAAHGQDGMAQSDQDADQRDGMWQAAEAQPAQGFRRKRQIGVRRQAAEDARPAPRRSGCTRRS